MRTTRPLNPIFSASRILLVFTFLSVASPLSFAQEAKKPATAQDESQPITLEPITVTVTVTAQKETEPVLSAPLSITAVTEDSLANSGIQAVKAAAVYVPNAFVNEFTARALSNPFFRGIGGSPANPGVSTVIDGVPQLNSYSSNMEWADIGQIEFVRGPEGALYGRNTAGGLINITSRSLSDSWKAQGQFDLGNYSRRDVRASVATPWLKNRFGVIFSGGHSSRDGYTVNDFSGRDLDSRDASFGKGQIFYQANDQLKFRLIFSGEHDSDGDFALGDLDQIRLHPHRVSRDFAGYNRRSVGSTTLHAEYTGSTVVFSSITGGVWWKNHGLTDLDYQTASLANYGLYATRDNAETQHQFTQEFRFASSKNRPVRINKSLHLDWQAGVFIFNQGYKQNATNNITSAFGFFPPSVSQSSADLGDSGMGLFGKTRFNAWGKLNLTVGLRLDYENKNARLASSSGPATSPSDSFSEFSPQFSLAYQFTPEQMAYASVTRGFKAGGFNPAPTGIPALEGTESYGPEHTWNYEVGHKASWLENRLETTLALFYIDWKNLQLNQQIPFSGGQYFIGNAGKANSKGLEIETRYRPYPWWELFGMLGCTRARFLSGSSAFNSNLGINQNVGGNTLPYAPTFNATLGTQVFWESGPYAKFFLRIQLSNHGDFQYDASNAAGQPTYHLVNLRGGIRTKHWFAEMWTDNAFNAKYVPIAIPYAQLGAPSGYVGESGAPRTYGLRLGLNF